METTPERSGITTSQSPASTEDHLKLTKKAEKVYRLVLDRSNWLQSHRLYDLPKASANDLVLGKVVGEGGFSVIQEVKLSKEKEASSIGSLYKSGESSKYVVKTLLPSLSADKKSVGVKALVTEALFLSTLKHEHILELRGWSSSGFDAFSDGSGFYLIYDQLQAALDDRIAMWARQLGVGATASPNKVRAGGRMTKMKRNAMFAERIKVAVDVASALEHLHSKNIIHRDVKPANIGFDQNGVVKIFDFGVATEVPQPVKDEENDKGNDSPGQAFQLSGNIGTPRYMAIEVIRAQQYDCKADVYSFTITLWELLALRKPFANLSSESVKTCVTEVGTRPQIPASWPKQLWLLLRSGWAELAADRPDMHCMRKELEAIYEIALAGKASYDSSSFNKAMLASSIANKVGKLFGRQRART